MRQANVVTFLTSIVFVATQCGEKESLDCLMGRTEITTAPDTMWYVIEPVSPDTLPVAACVCTDSIIWVNEFPSGGSSTLSIIIRGQSQLDLEIETYLGGTISIVPLARDNTGVFTDTVAIAASGLSGILLHQSSRLYVKNGNQVLDTILLDNPW